MRVELCVKALALLWKNFKNTILTKFFTLSEPHILKPYLESPLHIDVKNVLKFEISSGNMEKIESWARCKNPT